MVTKLNNKYTQGGMFAAGILIAGSEGAWMPWINILGVLIFLCAYLSAVIAQRPAPWR